MLLSRARILLVSMDLYTRLDHMQLFGRLSCHECAYCIEFKELIKTTVLEIEQIVKEDLAKEPGLPSVTPG
jgi:hypothetical protein